MLRATGVSSAAALQPAALDGFVSAPPGSGAALTFERVTFGYAEVPILREIDLDLRRGELMVVLGPNGSGKTTLLRLAAGLARPRAGRVRLADGSDAADAIQGGRIGYVPQHLGLVRSRTALDNVLVGTLRRAPRVRALLGAFPPALRDEALAALDAVGLREKADVKTHRLSGGERQRVAIARAIVQRPDVIVADELLSSLDVVQAHHALDVQRDLRRHGIAVLMSLHQLDVALAHADRVAFLRRGRLEGPEEASSLTPEEARCRLAD